MGAVDTRVCQTVSRIVLQVALEQLTHGEQEEKSDSEEEELRGLHYDNTCWCNRKIGGKMCLRQVL